jgi:uncharacterized protein YjbI with pentapeptide repeats
MTAKLRSWWQKIRRLLLVVGIIAASILVIVLVVGIIGGYLFNWNWTGLGPYISPPHLKDSDFQRGKTLWDWLQLLIVPLVLAIGGFWLSQMQKTTEQRSTTDNQRAAALQAYIDKISELLLKEHLSELTANGELKPEYDQVRNIARVLTLTVLRGLDAERKGSVLQFLYESGLISKDKQIINLSGANLSGASLMRADLRGVDLSGASLMRANLASANLREADLLKANLSGADLFQADLRGADLSRALLFEADLRGASLFGADLRGASMREAWLNKAELASALLFEADLRGAVLFEANITQEQWEQAKSLKGATMPDESTHP